MKEKFEGFKKFDSGKPAFELIPPKAIREVAQVLTYVAKKYEPYNWKECRDLDRLIGATLRHIFDWIEDPKSVDEESGIDHLAHAACDLLFLQELKYIIKDEKELLGDIMGKTYIHPDDKSSSESENKTTNSVITDSNNKTDFVYPQKTDDKDCNCKYNDPLTGFLKTKYFVLKPNGNDAYAIASRLAINTYAVAIKKTNSALAEDLINWIDKEKK